MDINQAVNANRATIESLLGGVPLPATKAELIAYASHQDRLGPAVAERLRSLPDREYRALPDVGEALEPRQPAAWGGKPPSKLPREESDVYPGGRAYLGEPVEPANVVAARSS